ncbi:MAG: hypothetical protein ACRDX9_07575 [Acidimicrobiia bacterium]
MIVVLAHYWGIDEVGVFVLPAVLAILALRWAEKKAKRSAAEKERMAASEEGTDVS